MRRVVTLPLLFFAAAATPAGGQTFPAVQRLPPESLESMRGGFDLPSGLVVTLGVVNRTAVDGQEVLRTVFDLRQGTPTFQTFADTGAGLVSIPTTDGMAGVETALGTLTVRSTAQGPRIDLSGRDLSISNLIGDAIGTTVANSANNRRVDVATSVNIEVRGLDPAALGNALPLANAIAADVAARLAR